MDALDPVVLARLQLADTAIAQVPGVSPDQVNALLAQGAVALYPPTPCGKWAMSMPASSSVV